MDGNKTCEERKDKISEKENTVVSIISICTLPEQYRKILKVGS